MLDEIRQQPAVLADTMEGSVASLESLRTRFRRNRPRLLVLVARGTSDNAAQFGRYLLEILTGIPVSLAAPSIYTLYGASVDTSDVAYIAISQSGESTDTNLVLERARERGAFTIGITNEEQSHLARIADHILLVRAGKERSVAATKTYTAQLLMLYLVAWSLDAPIALDDLRRIPDAVAGALSLQDEVSALASRYRFMDHALSVGRGLNYSNAFELALKLMETCYVIAERFSPADLLHGPIAMVHADFPAFAFAPPGVTWTPIREIIEKLDSLRAETLVITDPSNAAAAGRNGRRILLPPLPLPPAPLPPDLFTPIPYIVPGQLLACYLAQEKGLNPDQPRSLSKVTKTI